MRLRLDFADGWSHDEVVVSSGGRELCRLDGVTTRPATNLARRVELDLDIEVGAEGGHAGGGPGGGDGGPGGGGGAAAGPGVELRVEVPERGLAGSYRVEPGQERVVVNARADGLAFASPEGPYGYG